MSWGNIDNDNIISGRISTDHMENYYKSFCWIYGTLLFSFYFEFFAEEIASTPSEFSIVAEMRKCILEELRWPEMITFEEMNLEVPKIYDDLNINYKLIHLAITDMLTGGLISNDYEKFLRGIKNPEV